MAENKMVKYYSKIVGVTFEGRQEVIAKLTGKEDICVRREPDNKYDAGAVAIDAFVDNGWRPIGYISRDNEEVHLLLDQGKPVDVKITDITGGDDKSYGVNISVEHEKMDRPKYIEPEYIGALMPEILTQPNIPKPLHGMAPRTIMGDKWWNKTRQEVYATTDYHCRACGVAKLKAKKHQWLEAHEYYLINYETGTTQIISIEPLCHFCHNFIHSGRLTMILGKEKNESEVKAILEHGFAILAKNNLKCFSGTLELAETVGADTQGVEAYETPETDIEWKDWRLLFEGKEYGSKFRDMDEWHEFYTNENNKEKK